jgi:uncharacterized protein (DUF1015 family)
MCPPYDVISRRQQEKFYNMDPYNFIRIVLGKEEPGDNIQENKYTRAKKYFDEWMDAEILSQDKAPCFYFYLHEYSYKRKKKKRLGFIGLMKLEEENSRVYPHENTRSQPKEDRLELIRKVHANLSPIFAFFYDKEKRIAEIFQDHFVAKEADISVTDADNVTHKLWRLSDESLIEKIKEYMQDEHIFIADGHHRYEVAMNFYRQMKSLKNPAVPRGACNYIMTYFTNLDTDDLLILPVHRIVKKMPKDIMVLERDFSLIRLKSMDELFSLLADNRGTTTFGLYRDKEFILLKLKNHVEHKRSIPSGSDQYKCLDVLILEFLVFNQLGITSDDLIYTKDEESAIRAVDSREAQGVFFLNPVRVHQLRDIALGGEKMPPKSTYFYPKLLSGLVINKFE